jgi:hypothetical protein
MVKQNRLGSIERYKVGNKRVFVPPGVPSHLVLLAS